MGFYIVCISKQLSRTFDGLLVLAIAEAKNLVWCYSLITSFSTFAFSFKNFDEEVQRQLRMLEERAAKEDEEKEKLGKAT